jgi:opacity protein-like surface antigen
MTARVALVLGVLIWTATAGAATAAAQPSTSFGLGGRFSFVNVDARADDDSVRYTGGLVRLSGNHTAIEVAFDYRSTLADDQLTRVTSVPIQISLLYYPVRRRLAPYFLGGVGWYALNVERFTAVGDDDPVTQDTTRRFGTHAGLGADLRLHRRFAIHGDYRYTFLHLGEDDEELYSTPSLIPFANALDISHEGSMFTWGAVFYF